MIPRSFTAQSKQFKVVLSTVLIALCCVPGVSLAGNPATTPTEATFTVQ